jgi:hypothetical protein
MIFSGFPSVAQFVGLDVKSGVIDEFEYKVAFEWKVIM